MTTANTTTTTTSNEAQKEKVTDMNTEVNAQTSDTSVEATAELTKNTSWKEFQDTCDQIAKDVKTDTEELQMIASMLPVQDEFSIDNIVHFIKGDKEMYPPAPRKNKSAKSKTNPSAANQQRACLTVMLPHYAQWQKEKAQRIVDFEVTLKAETEERAKQAKRNMTAKQKAAFFDKVTEKVQDKNATKAHSDRKIEAIEKMFARALPKAYYLRKVSAENMTVNVERKTCTYTAFDYGTKQEEGNTIVSIASQKSEITETLAELQVHANIFTGYFKVTATRSTGKLSKAEKAKEAAKAAASINAVETAATNAKAMSEHIAVVQKNKKDLAAFRKGQQPKALFDKLFSALFVTDKVLDVAALQSAINHALGKAEIGSQCTVTFNGATEVKQSA